MRVCILVNHFPLRSQTFIVRLAEALVADASIECRIAAMKSLSDFDDMVRPAYRTALSESVLQAPGLRGGGAWRALRAGAFTLSCLVQAPVFALRALNVFRYGRRALRLHVLRLAWVLRGLPPFDAIRGQFLWFAGDLAACRELGVVGAPRLFASVRGADALDRRECSVRDLKRAAGEGVRFLPVSESLAEVMALQGCPRDLLTVVPSGLPLEAFPYQAPSGKEASRELRLLLVGRLTRKKGVGLAVRLVAALREQRVACRLVVVGAGPERDRAEGLARDLNLNTVVEFAGPQIQAEVIRHIRMTDLLVVPSVTTGNGNLEGIPNVAKEAMACGTVVVASRHSGLPELITDGNTGFLFAEGDLEAFVDAVNRARASRPRWDAIARATRDFVERHHSTEAMLTKLQLLYSGAAEHTSPQ